MQDCSKLLTLVLTVVPAVQAPPLAEGDVEGDEDDDGVLLPLLLLPLLVLLPVLLLATGFAREQAPSKILLSANTARSRTRVRHCFFAMVYKTSQIVSLKYAVSPPERALPFCQTRAEYAPRRGTAAMLQDKQQAGRT
jgi:hypothetical protein